MREYNPFVTVAFGGFYTIFIMVLGGTNSFKCDIENTICVGTDRIIQTPELMVALALPLIGLAFIHTFWYGRSRD